MNSRSMQNDIATNWLLRSLGEIATISRGGSPRPIDSYITNASDGLNWLRIGDVSPTARYIYATSQKIKKEGLSKTTLVHSGDFILSNSMSFGRPYIMKTSACIHDGWLALRNIKKDLISADFLYFLLLSKKLQNEFILISAGSGVQNLKKETVSSVVVRLPTVLEQRRIVAVLETLDQLIEGLGQKIEIKKQMKRGLVHHLLDGKTRLSGFSDKRRTFSFEDVAKPRKERFDVRKSSSQKFCIELENIEQGTGQLLGGEAVMETASLKTNFYPGDVLFGKLRAYLKKYWLADREGVCSTEIWVLEADKTKILPQILFQITQSDRFISVATTSQGTHMPRSSWDIVSDFQVLLPGIDEQRSMVKIFESIEKELLYLSKKLSLFKAQKKYLLNNLITGMIRTPEDLTIPKQASNARKS